MIEIARLQEPAQAQARDKTRIGGPRRAAATNPRGAHHPRCGAFARLKGRPDRQQSTAVFASPATARPRRKNRAPERNRSSDDSAHLALLNSLLSCASIPLRAAGNSWRGDQCSNRTVHRHRLRRGRRLSVLRAVMDLSRAQLSGWRRLAREGLLSPVSADGSDPFRLVPVVASGAVGLSARSRFAGPASAQGGDRDRDGGIACHGAGIDEAHLVRVLRGVRSAS